jgi:hypothetical protein
VSQAPTDEFYWIESTFQSAKLLPFGCPVDRDSGAILPMFYVVFQRFRINARMIPFALQAIKHFLHFV